MTVSAELHADLVESLMTMEDDDFTTIVSDDVKNKLTDTMAEALRDDEVLDRWAEALVVLYCDVADQLARHKGDDSSETRQWRGGAIRYSGRVAARKKEARTLTVERNMARNNVPRRPGDKTHHLSGHAILSASPKELRAQAGEAAISKLKDVHSEEFVGYLVDEYTARELPIPDAWLDRLSA